MTLNFLNIKLKHLILVSLTFLISIYTVPYWMNYLLRFSLIDYNIGTFNSYIGYFIFGDLIYCYLAYRFNVSLLKAIKKNNIFHLSIQMLIDIHIIPLSMYIIIKTNNNDLTQPMEMGSLLNIFMIIVLLMIKHISILILTNNIFIRKQKNKS